jgi:hypothetical protein
MSTIMESSIGRTIREELLPTIYDLGGPMDPLYKLATRSWSDVVRNTGIGRNYQVHKIWGTGIAGGGSFGSALGSQMLDTPQNFSAFGAPETWPGHDEVVAPTFLRTIVQLIKHKLNLFIPRDILQSDMLDASIGQVVPFYIKGFARNVLLQELGTFYSTAPATVAWADIGDTSVTVTNVSGDTTAVNISLGGTGANSRIHRFERGTMVDQYNAAGTVKRNTGFFMYIDNVDYAAQVIRVRRLDGGELQTTTVLNGGVTYAGTGADDDILVLKDSIGFTPGTMEAWVADGTDNTSFFGIDVRDHGQFKSISQSLSGAPLTESLLNRHYGYFWESFPEADLGRAVTTMGVLLGFIDNLDQLIQGSGTANPGRFRYERNGKAVDVSAGWNTFDYKFAGRNVDIHTSRFLGKGRWYSGKFDLTRYIPPPIPGTTMDSRIGDELQFLASSGGSSYDKIFTRADYNGRFSNMLQAPCERKYVICPGQPNFLKLHTIAEMTGF